MITSFIAVSNFVRFLSLIEFEKNLVILFNEFVEMEDLRVEE